MNDYQYTALVFDGGFNRLKDDAMGYLWHVGFKGTLYRVPKALAELPTDVVLTGSVPEDVLRDAPPLISCDWEINHSGYKLADTFADLQPIMLMNSIRVNGISVAGTQRFEEYCQLIDELPNIAYHAILNEIPKMR